MGTMAAASAEARLAHTQIALTDPVAQAPAPPLAERWEP